METYNFFQNADKDAEAEENICKRKAEGDNDDVCNSKKIAPSGEEKKATFMRKNIRDVIDENKLDSITLAAQREESERLARVNEQQKLIREHQRQTAVIRQNARTQSKVLTLLQSGNAFAKLTELTSSFANDGESTDGIHDLKEEFVDESKIEINSDEPETQESCEIVTIDDSSDDDCILLSDDEEAEVSLEEEEDTSNSGMHVKDSYNVPDDQGRVVVNIGHPDTEDDIYVAPQIARFIKPHQIGGVRFLFDNIIESTDRFKTSTGFGCILAHSMGLGKTLQVVCFCDLFLRHTDSRTILCVMPINTIQNWLSEFNMWTPRYSDNENNIRPRTFEVFALNDQQKTLSARAKVIKKWSEEGGVLLIGYELFRLLALKLPSRRRKGNKEQDKDDNINNSSNTKNLYADIQKALVKPGPDLVICDEGHRIKNSNAGISVALKQIKTRRRIVLTGYPLQNNLLEYWCMVDFVRPNYLGTRTEFCNMFERPIQNGQCIDSTPSDIKLMRYRAHVLHSLLVGFVQRRSHVVLTETLPEKHEFIILTKMSKFQRNLYKSFMTNVVLTRVCPNPLKAFAVCCKIWNHPDVLYNFLKKRQADLDLEIDDVTLESSTTSIPEKPDDPDLFSSKSNTSSSLDSSHSDLPKKFILEADVKRAYMHGNYNLQQQQYPGTENEYWNYSESYDPCRSAQYTPSYVGTVKESNAAEKVVDHTNSSQIVDLDTQEIKTVSAYVKPQFEELRKEKIKIASNSVEHLTKVKGKMEPEKSKVEPIDEKDDGRLKNDEESVSYDWATELMVNYTPGLIENSPKMEIVFYILKESIEMGDRVLLFSQSLLTLNLIEQFLQLNTIPTSNDYWCKGSSYFRLDGSTSAQERERLVNEFNSNSNVKLFLISTRAGSLGINLIGANRVIIFDASWNPCHDTQAVYRVYRFGQKKACFIYRIVMDRCLEKKIYDRQIKKQGMSNRVVDECNPESHLSIKDVSNLCHNNESDLDDDKDDSFVQQNEHYEDDILLNIVKIYKNLLSKEPFRHESLLLDRKERKLSQAEKRLAHRGYEAEKKCISQKISINNIQYRMGQSDNTYVVKPSNIATRPVKNMKTTIRSSRWIPADVWQRQGMTAQEMTLPLDVVIPTNSSDKTNIILKAGQRVMVLKSTKGIYMQLESGKIIAIRTSSANKTVENSVANTEKKIIKNEIIDITADGDGSDETEKCGEESDENKTKEITPPALEEENKPKLIMNAAAFPKTDDNITIKKSESSEDSVHFSSSKKWSHDSQVFSQANELATPSSGSIYNKEYCGSTSDNSSEKACSTNMFTTKHEDTSKHDSAVDSSKSLLSTSTDYLHSNDAGRLRADVEAAPNINTENLDMNISNHMHSKNLNDSLESTNYSINSNSSSSANRDATTLKNVEYSMPIKNTSENFFHTSMYDSHINAQRYNYNSDQNASQSYIPMNVPNNTNTFMPATNLDNYYYNNYNSNGGYIEQNNLRHHRPYADYTNYQAYSNVPYPNYPDLTNGHCTSAASSSRSSDFKSYNYPWPNVNLPIPPSSNICSTNINNSNYSNVPDTNCWPN